MADRPTLTYFRGRGRAESVRLMLTAAGVQWNDAPYLEKAEQVDSLREKGVLEFGQVPLLEWEGGNMVQTMSIVRHIARKFGLDGKDTLEKYKVDMLTEGARDFLPAFLPHKFIPDKDFLSGITKSAAKYLPFFEKALQKSGTGFLVGNALTMADVALFEVLLLVEEQIAEKLNDYNLLQSFFSKLKSLPNFAAYLSSDKRFPPNSEEYVAGVKAALRW